MFIRRLDAETLLENPGHPVPVWVQSLVREGPLEESTATGSRILAWRIPWTEEPGGS